jgi:hypothetical protein
MRYMMLVMGNADYQAGKPPSPALMAEIGKLSEEARRSGKLVMSEGLKPRETRIRLVKGKRQVTDGPFTETKEMIGGFAIFELASDAEALAAAQQFVDAHARCGLTDFEMLIRPMYGPEDFAGK